MTFSVDSDVDADRLDAGAPSVRIVADISNSFTYASYQNAIPVLRSIMIENLGSGHYAPCKVEVTSSPAFLRPKTWQIDRLAPGDVLPLSDRRAELDAGYLAGLNEAERGEITVRLTCGEEVLDEQLIPVRLLARDEWGGVSDMAQLLPAFVMPNDPAVSRVLRKAAQRLVEHGHPSGLDGYQTGDPKRAYMLTAAIYSAVASMGVFYAEPPASFEHRGQKVRRPTTIAEERLATCLDTTLLFAGALEAAGLHPVILMFRGHAALGVWLTQRTLANTIETDHMEVRKALASNELIVFETTGVTHRPAMTLEAAQNALAPWFAEEKAEAFVAAVDVRRARSGGITPLASHDPMKKGPADHDDSAPVADLALPATPTFTALPADAVEQKPTSAAGRVDRWQKKLLDLTLRNRLLNFPPTKKTIPFLCPDVAYLEDRLADGASFQIISLPEQNPLGERDPALYREVHGRDIQRSFAAEALLRDELPSPLDQQQLLARLIDLHRQVRNDMAEGGANTLFLAVGFLRWKKKPEDERSYRAPLLLAPVKLERRSASSPFRIRFHEDEPRFNSTLLQFLEREFDLKLHGLADLPFDDNGIDVPRLLASVRAAVRDVPGLEVVDETALSTFSFAKFLMWKDLVERTDALRENRVVRHLIDNPEQAFAPGEGVAAFHEERDLDRVYNPADIVCLLPSDSSQTAASLAAAEGRDFVIVGPPGTGKSQTIANMIANCLAVGKTVLFVAEKTAALDVVYRRLREHGLGDFCIELHSNKADRRRFLTQLKSAWENGGGNDRQAWITVNERLQLRRDTLNAYVEALHKPYPNGWSAYQALGIALKDKDRFAPRLDWPASKTHDAAALSHLEAAAAEVGQVFTAVERRPALDLVDINEWSAGKQDELLAAARALRTSTQVLGDALDAVRAGLALVPVDLPVEDEINGLKRLTLALKDSRRRDLSIAFHPDYGRTAEDLDALSCAVAAYRLQEGEIKAGFSQTAVRDLDLDALDRQWRDATASIWPMSALGRRKITRLLQGYADRGVVQPDHDLSRLRAMKTRLAEIDASPLKGRPLPFHGLETDIDAAASLMEGAGALRDALRLSGRSEADIAALSARIAAGLRDDGQQTPVIASGDRLLAAIEGFAAARDRFSTAAGAPVQLEAAPQGLAALAARLDELIEAQHLLRDWSTWRQARNRAVGLGLGAMVEALESGDLEPDQTQPAFRLAYARWWLPNVLDSDAVLRDFRRFQHENMISEFREIDDLVRKHAAQRVISALARDLPPVQSVARNSELGLLRHQMELQRPSQSIRDMISRMPNNFGKLAPCMLMSPLSIAQYFPPNQSLFDVVIFDEASQITTWDAVGAIARARQTIIVGDPKQLPPTNFFGRNEEEEDIEDHEKDLESILDEAKASGIPVRDLRWHYRSRSESLIAFSNHHYYQNRLVTFPSPQVDDRAVKLRKVPNGVYDRGKTRTNRIEAQAVVDEAVQRMRSWLALPEQSRPTLGVITFNAQQQALILDLLDAARRDEPELEWFFAEERVEAAIVKNLENVQGDERDVILFSITFWKDATGKLTMDFGALNRDGGEKRLNVAVTRARQELVVFSGFTADQIDPTRTKALAVHHLKTFLDFAERGSIALSAQNSGSMGGFDSPFEEAVAAQLERRGWQVVPQVGMSGFRIDLGIRHPDLPGAYLAGVECDGATYHSAATARDRDKVREQVLRGLGWNILRVWSTDWWYDADGCAERLHDALDRLLDDCRGSRAVEEQVTAHWDMGHEVEDVVEIRDDTAAALEDDLPSPSGVETSDLVSGETAESLAVPAASSPGAAASGLYRLTDLGHFPIDPGAFYEFGYRSTLQAMIDHVMQTEAPLRTDILCQRIARAHGWLRTGGRIRERIEIHLRSFDRTLESSGEFLWPSAAVSDFLPYRRPADEEARRAIPDIPLAELAQVVRDHPGLLDESDPARELARLLGVERLAAGSRARLEEALVRSQTAAPVEV